MVHDSSSGFFTIPRTGTRRTVPFPLTGGVPTPPFRVKKTLQKKGGSGEGDTKVSLTTV